GHAAAAQDWATYTHIRIHTRAYEKANKKIKKKEIRETAGQGEAQITYSPAYLRIQTSKGADTVFLSSINKATSDLYGNIVYIAYNNRSEEMTLFFYDRREAAACKKFMRENGGNYKRRTLAKIGGVILEGAISLTLFAWWWW
ncbi:MAG: hypothetical protein CRN43_07300, partial [Candidatus Nephrothrix sp. EaCA]